MPQDGRGGQVLLDPGDREAWGLRDPASLTFFSATDVTFRKGESVERPCVWFSVRELWLQRSLLACVQSPLSLFVRFNGTGTGNVSAHARDRTFVLWRLQCTPLALTCTPLGSVRLWRRPATLDSFMRRDVCCFGPRAVVCTVSPTPVSDTRGWRSPQLLVLCPVQGMPPTTAGLWLCGMARRHGC